MKSYLYLITMTAMVLLIFSCSKTEEMVPNEPDVIVYQEVNQTANKDVSFANPGYDYPPFAFLMTPSETTTSGTTVTLSSLSDDLYDVSWKVFRYIPGDTYIIAQGAGEIDFYGVYTGEYKIRIHGALEPGGTQEFITTCIYIDYSIMQDGDNTDPFPRAYFGFCNENTTAQMGSYSLYNNSNTPQDTDNGPGGNGVIAVVVPVVVIPE